LNERVTRPTAATRRTALLLLAGAVAVFAAAFLKLADSVRESELVVSIDHRSLDFFSRHRVGWITRVARLVTLLGSGWVIAVVVVAAATFFLLRRRPLDAMFVVLSSSGTALLVSIVKHSVGRSRPDGQHRLVSAAGASFPSGHAAQSVAGYVALAVIVASVTRSRTRRTLACAGAATLALAIGASRVYLGVHWLSDVVSGWLLAGGWLLALIGLRLAVFGYPARPHPDAEPARRHRRRTIPIAAIVVLAVALGGFGLLWRRTTAHQVSIGTARRRFDQSSSTQPPVAAALRPAAGVYVYRGSGTEHLSLPPKSQGQGPQIPATVTQRSDGCWTFRIDYSSAHWQTWDYCPRGGGLVELGGQTFERWDFVFTKYDSTSTFVCDPPSVTIRAGMKPGEQRQQRCRGTSTGTKGDAVSAGSFTFVGEDTITVNGIAGHRLVDLYRARQLSAHLVAPAALTRLGPSGRRPASRRCSRTRLRARDGRRSSRPSRRSCRRSAAP
jgi:undecaprenyl-diphosphatase